MYGFAHAICVWYDSASRKTWICHNEMPVKMETWNQSMGKEPTIVPVLLCCCYKRKHISLMLFLLFLTRSRLELPRLAMGYQDTLEMIFSLFPDLDSI